jgi:cell division protease FtsH
MPKGVLLYGPPGTGKTILAKAIAGESSASFISQSASSFVDTYVGQGAASIRMLFKEARSMKPCVIFIDEIDAIATKRSMGGSEERLQALNQLLIEMDGFEDNKGIVVVSATNRVEVIDEAIVRPGRFDRKVLINLPTESERVEILNIYIDKNKIFSDVDVNSIAKKTISFSGADLENLVNEAAIEAARESNEKISMKNFDNARDRILMGVKNSRRPTNEEYKILAYHELGHAILSYISGRKVEKISIVPRGMSLGVTINEFKDDILRSETDLKNDVIILMAGRAAEDIFCNQITTGSHDDINKASNIARQMVSVFGFNKDAPYIPESEALKIKDESYAKEILKESYESAKTELEKHKDTMNILFDILIENKEISGSVIENVLYKKN